MPPRPNSNFDPSNYIKIEPGMLCGENSSYINYSDICRNPSHIYADSDCCGSTVGIPSSQFNFEISCPDYAEYYRRALCCPNVIEEKEEKLMKDTVNAIDTVFDLIKEQLTEYAQENCVKKIIRNGPATIVFWDDGTKTIVKRAKGTKDDIYMAFCSAFAKKMLGSNSRIQRIIKKNLVTEEKGSK